MNQLIEQFFNLDVMKQAFPFVLKGLGVTILISAVLVPSGLLAGLILALASGARNGVLRNLTRLLVSFFRAFPPLVLIILAFSALPFLGIRLPALGAAFLAMVITAAVYYSEILRAGLESVPRGQAEAARSTGLNATQTLYYVTLPQAIRNVYPELASNTIEVVKFTSLASIIGVHDMLHMAGVARSVTYNTSPLVLASLLYLLFLMPLVRLVGRLQHSQAAR